MTSEQPPRPDSINEHRLGEATLAQWYQFVCRYPGVHLDLSAVPIPGNRYGRTIGEAAWWSVAAALVHAEAEYDLGDLSQTIYGIHVQILEDDPGPGLAVRDVLALLPEDLADKLDWERYFYPDANGNGDAS
jgi:hypothetical protein